MGWAGAGDQKRLELGRVEEDSPLGQGGEGGGGDGGGEGDHGFGEVDLAGNLGSGAERI
ncbi:UNVERIFIED_CONTAM: hypothetical protein Sradi_2933200 [Sesamum radiatum]|uniref:Uncharacterized protein n=1 Tax=Sesamum radiatum TaxID=300843 RepID=A0AAW2RZ44_SESRA